VKNIVYYGGAFNPIGNHHILIALSALEKGFDEVHLIPSCNPPGKKGVLSFEHRCNMIKLAICNYSNVKLNTVEGDINPNSTNYTVDIVKHLMKQNDNQKIWLLMGSDNFKNIDSWYKPEELKQLVHFVVVQRSDHQYKTDVNNSRLVDLSIPESEISATFIRNRIKQGLPIDMLVNPFVDEYIKCHKLYQ
jgi:nicotinate-nucleotide adenylyltransferase